MKRLTPSVKLSVPTLKQVLWRSGCPPHKAGEAVEAKALNAIAVLEEFMEEVYLGVVSFAPEEHPDFLREKWPGKLLCIAVTSLGPGIDRLLDGPAKLERFMLDSAASVAVESYMKTLQLAVARELNMVPTRRIAPGYGDFPLAAQQHIISFFPDSGITCNDSFMLTPVKTMTGVTGWMPQKSS